MPDKPRYERRRTRKTFQGETKTDPSGAQNLKIEKMLGEYRANGTMPRVSVRKPLYGDFSNARDLHDQQIAFQEAEAHFGLLPAAVRKAADNDMIRYVEMIEAESDEGRILLHQAGLQIEGWEPPEIPPSQPSLEPRAGAPAAQAATPPAEPEAPAE